MQTQVAAPRWWCEAEVGILLVLVCCGYFLRSNDVTLRAEEPRWAQVAFEAQERGDWIVPREQGAPFMSRPPLHSWLIATSTSLFGTRAAWAVRLPSLLGTLATVFLIYGYSRIFLSRLGSLAAAAAFATLGEMFSTGFQAETEAVFIPLVSGSLLLWHWGRVRGWSDWTTWITCYSLVGLAVLAKGPQPPVYFLGSVGLYLLLTGELRRLFRPAHLVGMAIGAAIVLAWMVPCALRVGWPTVWGIFGSDTAMRFREWRLGQVANHMAEYPFEVLGSTAPWSLLLVFYLRPDFRRSIGAARPQVLFLATCLTLAFVSCWIPPGGQTRYLSPLYPCLAVLVGLVVERCAAAEASPGMRRTWRWYAALLAGVTIAAGLGAVVVSLFFRTNAKVGSFAEPPLMALGFAVVAGVLAMLMLRGRLGGDAGRVRSVVLAMAWFMAVTFAGPVTNARVRRSEDQPGAIAHLKDGMPRGTRLISYGHTDALFAFYYGELIESRPVPTKPSEAPEEGVYFSYYVYSGARLPLPFPFEEIAAISMDRDRRARPEREVVVGRVMRKPSGLVAAH